MEDTRQEDEIARLEATLKTPITKEEADKEFADSEVLRAQLHVARQRTMAEITQLQLKINAIDEQLLVVDLNRAVTYRRALNNAGAAK